MKIEIKITYIWFLKIVQVGHVVSVDDALRQGPKRLYEYYTKVKIEDVNENP
jgi:hypothetical protein